MDLDKALSYITKGLLLATLIIPPFVVIESLFFPFVSGRVYVFRLLVEITFFFWILLIARNPEYRPRLKNPIVIATLLFLLGLVITAFLGVDPWRSFFSNIERADGVIQFTHWAAYFLMIVSVVRSARDWRIFLWVFTVVAFGVAAYAWKLNEPRLAGFFNNPSYLAAFMLFSIGLAGILWAYTKREQQKWANFVIGGLILFFLATLVFTQTRGTYLGLTVGFLLFTLLLLTRLRREKKKLALGAVGISLLILATIGSIFVFRGSEFIGGNQILSRIAVVSDLTNLGAARERYLGWAIAFESFKERPLFGWGPENYDVAFNEHYNYLAAKDESWFDSSHNQLMDVLAEGGIVGFALYLFWIGAIFYAAGRLLTRGTRDKLIGAIVAGTFFGFLVQGWFLFDTFPMYLGLFPLLGFIYFRYEGTNKETVSGKRSLGKPQVYILVALLLLSISFSIFKNVWQPYQANRLIVNFNQNLYAGNYRGAVNYLEAASGINSPYTNFDVGNQGGWILLYFLDNQIPAKDKEIIRNIWQQVVAREERSLAIRPLDPQAYYVLGRLYRRGYDQFGDSSNLVKAEAILKKGRDISHDRVEYVNELIDVLSIQGRTAEAEAIGIKYASGLPSPYSNVYRGHLYFAQKKFDLATGEYEEAEKLGYPFWREKPIYARFVVAAGQVNDYQAVIRLSQLYIDHQGASAEAFFNQAVGYYNLGNREEARRVYLKALTLDRTYERYASFFTPR